MDVPDDAGMGVVAESSGFACASVENDVILLGFSNRVLVLLPWLLLSSASVTRASTSSPPSSSSTSSSSSSSSDEERSNSNWCSLCFNSRFRVNVGAVSSCSYPVCAGGRDWSCASSLLSEPWSSAVSTAVAVALSYTSATVS